VLIITQMGKILENIDNEGNVLCSHKVLNASFMSQSIKYLRIQLSDDGPRVSKKCCIVKK
jgi:hypothetical protein